MEDVKQECMEEYGELSSPIEQPPIEEDGDYIPHGLYRMTCIDKLEDGLYAFSWGQELGEDYFVYFENYEINVQPGQLVIGYICDDHLGNLEWVKYSREDEMKYNNVALNYNHEEEEEV